MQQHLPAAVPAVLRRAEPELLAGPSAGHNQASCRILPDRKHAPGTLDLQLLATQSSTRSAGRKLQHALPRRAAPALRHCRCMPHRCVQRPKPPTATITRTPGNWTFVLKPQGFPPSISQQLFCEPMLLLAHTWLHSRSLSITDCLPTCQTRSPAYLPPLPTCLAPSRAGLPGLALQSGPLCTRSALVHPSLHSPLTAPHHRRQLIQLNPAHRPGPLGLVLLRNSRRGGELQLLPGWRAAGARAQAQASLGPCAWAHGWLPAAALQQGVSAHAAAAT